MYLICPWNMQFLLVDSIFSVYPVNQTGFVSQKVKFHCSIHPQDPKRRYYVYFLSYNRHGKSVALEDYKRNDDWTSIEASLTLTEATNGTSVSCVAAPHDDAVHTSTDLPSIQGPPVYAFCQGTLYMHVYYFASISIIFL